MAEIVPSSSRGFVYVATGENYVAEARASAASLRAAMPDAQVALITDTQPEDVAGLFTHVIIRPEVQRRPIDKLLAWDAPFERCVFLDTDTHVAGDLSGLFDLLETFDLAAAPETLRGWHYTLPGIPEAFAEFNTGVIVFRRTPAVAAFFQTWRTEYEKLLTAQGFVSDQPAFRSAMFNSGLRMAPLPSEFHFITITPNYTMWQVRLAHGRGDLPGLIREFNRKPGARAFVPGLGPVIGFQGRASWLRQLARLVIRALAVALHPSRLGRSPKNHWSQEEQTLTASRKKPGA